MPGLALLARHLGVIPAAGSREAMAEHARMAYERTVTEKWNLDALSDEQLEQWIDIIRTVQLAQANPDTESRHAL